MKVDQNEKKKPAILGTFTGKCCDSNVWNNNDMHLSRELFEKLIASDEFKRAMENRHYVGFLSHPEDMDCQDDKNACIVMTDLRILDNGEIEGDFDLVNTPVGQVVKTFIDAGVKYGISIRGLGDVAADGEVDPDDFIFRGFDLVRFPAYDDCIPEFKAVAASTDTKKKAAYKKICASIDANLKDITSSEALEFIKDEFAEGSDEYNKIQDRINELACDDVPCDDTAYAEDEKDAIISLQTSKLDAVTDLYLDAQAKVHDLEQELATACANNQMLTVTCKSIKSKYKHLKHVTANQIEAANNRVDKLTDKIDAYKEKYVAARTELRETKSSLVAAQTQLRDTKSSLKNAKESYTREVKATSDLEKKLDRLMQEKKDDKQAIESSNNLNLKYQRRIEANSEAISRKDSAIEDLKSELHETVVANRKLESKASNLGDKCEELKSRVEAAEEMVLSYQQAYANIYANALGVYLPDMPITAQTSVEELSQMIKAATSTANIPAKPAVMMYEDVQSDEDVDDEDLDMTDDTTYSAEMITL